MIAGVAKLPDFIHSSELLSRGYGNVAHERKSEKDN